MNDDMMKLRRAETLRDVVELRRPLADAAAALAQFGWDSDEELITLTRVDVLRVLHRYRQGSFAAEDCRRWAEILEGRDDLALESGFESQLKEFLFELATPELTEPLSPDVATRWQAHLEV